MTTSVPAKKSPTSMAGNTNAKKRAIDEVQIVYMGTVISQKARYVAGHVMTEYDAEIANRAVVNAARAAFNEKAKAMREADTSKEEIIAQFAKFLSEYRYQPVGVREPFDPVVEIALGLARSEIVTAMKATGIKVADITAASLKAATKVHLKKNEERIMALAEEQSTLLS